MGGEPHASSGDPAIGRPKAVPVAPLSPDRFKDVLDENAWQEFQRGIESARQILAGRAVWNINSTAAGGGVAEMLRSLLAYTRGAGIDARWTVIAGTPEFFRVTKRIHNFLHGTPGDGGELGEDERRIYESVGEANAEDLAAAIQSQDLVLLHDPQTAGLVHRLKETGAGVVWRSHVGAEQPNELVERAWSFLAPYLEAADACVFSRRAYVPDWATAFRTQVIQPSIDVFSPKNQEMSTEVAHSILRHVGLAIPQGQDGPPPAFTRHDGSPGRVDRVCEVLSSGPPPALDAPLVVQVSRWDRLKDPIGVMHGFSDYVPEADAHLVLAGPAVRAVADDPEGAEVLDEVEAGWRKLPAAKRRRVHLASLPMTDLEENAAIVNALQRHATVVVQKSLQEGFGLTVAEAMWKSRPVVASAVGGIRDQIEDGVTGLLLGDPTDLRGFGETTLRLLSDRELATSIGTRAREHVRTNFLANRHALQYIELFKRMV